MPIIEGVHREKLLESIRRLERNQSALHSLEKKNKEKAAGGEKIANLARRISELPAGVPAEPFYAEMRTLAGANNRLESEIRSLEQTNQFQKIATESQLDKLFTKMREQISVAEVIDAETKRKVIHALVHQVVITKTGFKMHFYFGVDQIKKGERRLEVARSLLKAYEKTRAEKISVPGSLKGSNGGRCSLPDEPLIVRLDYGQPWLKIKIEPRELAKLRDVGLTIREIAERLRVGRTRAWQLLSQCSQ